MDGLFPRGPSVGARPAGTTGWPARAFGSIDVFKGPVGDPRLTDGDAQAANSTIRRTTEEVVRTCALHTERQRRFPPLVVEVRPVIPRRRSRRAETDPA